MPRIEADHTVTQAYKLSTMMQFVDLCNACHCAWLDADLEIEHPPYSDDRHYCFECGKRLTDDDNM